MPVIRPLALPLLVVSAFIFADALYYAHVVRFGLTPAVQDLYKNVFHHIFRLLQNNDSAREVG